MQPFYQDAQATLYLGDSRAVLPTLRAHSVDALVTDPPAGVGFMGVAWDSFSTPKGGERSDAGWDWTGSKERPRTAERQARVVQKQGEAFRAFLTPILAESLRVLKPGGHALVWGLPRTSHWTATALEDAGFEIRDCITHLFGQGFPKSLNLHGEHEGWGTALKPGAEFWWLARAPLSEPTVAANVARWGTGALNIDGCRVGIESTLRTANKPGVLHYDGANHRPHHDGPPRHRQTGGTTGRWPANVVLSHTLFCEQVGIRQVRTASPVLGTEPSASTTGIYSPYGQRAVNPGRGDIDGLETVEAWACTPGCPVALLDAQSGRTSTTGRRTERSRAATVNGTHWGTDNHRSTEYPGESGGASRFYYVAKPGRAERNAGLSAPNTHPTVKSAALMAWLIRLVTPPGGIVLDPFMGSGSTGLAVRSDHWRFIGIEVDERYCEIAVQRLAQNALPLGAA